MLHGAWQWPEFLSDSGSERQGGLTVKRIIVLLALAASAVVVAAPAVAGAQVSTPAEGSPAVQTCTITSLDPPADRVIKGQDTLVTVKGTAPRGVHLKLYISGDSTAVAQTDAAADGSFTLVAMVKPPVELTVGFTYGDGNAYAASCTDSYGGTVLNVSDVVVTRNGATTAAATPAATPAAAQLAFTGSSNTPTYVLVGLAALVLGLVLVVAARRRTRVNA
jgi:LPXTG-motif cell wall-anchored protein